MKNYLKFTLVLVLCWSFVGLNPYPIDGYSRTGIKRLLRLERIKSGEIKDASALPAGAMKSYNDIKLSLISKKKDSTAQFLIKDEKFNKEINGLFYGLDKSYSLSVLDISDINNIKLANRLKDVFPYNYVFPQNADAVNWQKLNMQNGVVVDWVITREKREIIENELVYMDTALEMASNEGPTVGKGGSLARFKIVNSYLYAVDSHSIHIFDIKNLDTPNKLESIYAGFDIETIFNLNQYLFLGSMSGMFIYDISKPDVPQFVAEFRHGTACDPVIVDGSYAMSL